MFGQMLVDITVNLLSETLKEYTPITLFLTILIMGGWKFYKRKNGQRLQVQKGSPDIEFEAPVFQRLLARDIELKKFRRKFKLSSGGVDQSVKFASWLIEKDIPIQDARLAINGLDNFRLELKSGNLKTKRHALVFVSLLILIPFSTFVALVASPFVVASF